MTALHRPSDGGKRELINVTIPSPAETEFTPMLAGFANLEVASYSITGEHGGLSNAGLWFRSSGLVERKA